jgi:hypothetical protein
MPHQVHDAQLNLHLREHRFDGSRKALQSIDTGHKDILALAPWAETNG